MSTPNENRHMSAGHTTARFITSAERAAGVTPETVAAEVAAQEAARVGQPNPHDIGQRGISVKILKGTQPTSGPVEPAVRAEVRNVRVEGARALELAKAQGASVFVGDSPEPVTLHDFAQLFDAQTDERMRAVLVSAVWVELDVLGRVVSLARSLPSPSPSGAEGLGAVEVDDAVKLGPDAAAAFARPGGPTAHVHRRNDVQQVAVRGQNQRVGAAAGSLPGVRTYGGVAVIEARKAVQHVQQVALAAAVAAKEAVEAVAAELDTQSEAEPSELETLAADLTTALERNADLEVRIERERKQADTAVATATLNAQRASAAADTATRDAAELRLTVQRQADELQALTERVQSFERATPTTPDK